jgi:hypothetical protein
MQGVLLVPRAIFFNFKTTRGIFLILASRVIATLALGAGENDIDAHNITR